MPAQRLHIRAVHTRHHLETHRSGRAAWLRAAVLGSDDAIVSNASLMIGVAASGAPSHAVMMAGVAGLCAGAMSMGVGEYVSVSTQRDAERADIALEQHELATEPQSELQELAGIYEQRGLDRELALRVATQLSAHDPLRAHMLDELGIAEQTIARPLQAATASALSFAVFALLPFVGLAVVPSAWRIAAIAATSLVGLALLGALGARLGGAPIVRAALRVVLGGGLAMAITAAVGRLFGVATQ
jgi:vacuolar iron transporter family protein